MRGNIFYDKINIAYGNRKNELALHGCLAFLSLKFASLSFSGFFCQCRKLGYRSWVTPLCILLSEPVSSRLLNTISTKLCHQNTQFIMYATTSKQQEVLRAKIRIQNVL